MFSSLGTSIRTLRREPLFVAATVLTLAIGAAANTAVFNLATTLFMAPLPVAEPDRLLRVCPPRDGGGCDVMSYPNVMDVGERSTTLAAVAAHRRTMVAMGRPPTAEMASVELVSGRYFEVMGLRALAGRLLAPDDDAVPGAHPLVVVSHDWWRLRLDADASAVGRTVELAGTPFTIVGVAPPRFQGAYGAFAVDFWAPLSMAETLRPRGSERTHRGWGWLEATGRLRPGATLEAARAEIAVIGQQLSAEYPGFNEGLTLTAVPARALPEGMARNARGVLAGLQLAALLVLAVGAANVASAQMARAIARRRDTAVRLSLGASRGSLVRLWAGEALLLALLAGVAGTLLGVWLRDGLLAVVAQGPGMQTFAPAAGVDLRMFAFATVLMTVVGVIAGLVPALRSAGADPAFTLRDEATTTSGRGARWQTALVVGQVAVSTALLGFALILLHAVQVARAFDPGFPTGGLVLADSRAVGRAPTPGEEQHYLARALERLRAIPGVTSATYALVVPLGPNEESRGVRRPGQASPDFVSVDANVAGPSYFATMGIPIVAGRDFSEEDLRSDAPMVAVVNETFIPRFFPSGRAVGERLSLGSTEVQIVGVARDIAYHALGEAARPHLYLSPGTDGAQGMVLHVRVRGDASVIARAVENALAGLDPRVITRASTFDRLREVPLAPRRLIAWLAAASGAVALFLTAVGLFGLMAYTVGQRTREIGIRVALGARPSSVRAMVLRRGLLVALGGMLPGTGAAMMASDKLADGLFGLSATDPVALAALWVLVMITTAAACWLPARRATRVDPIVALRHS